MRSPSEFFYLKFRQNRNDFFKSTFPPKNERMNLILLLWDLFSFVFWRKLKTAKRHFENFFFYFFAPKQIINVELRYWFGRCFSLKRMKILHSILYDFRIVSNVEPFQVWFILNVENDLLSHLLNLL